MYKSTKTYGHNIGLSACFRQWRAESHCRFLHGYALSVKLTFVADGLDSRNWVQDFGSLKPVKKYLEDTFDHKTLVAADDPKINEIVKLDDEGIIDVVIVEATGCEAFAKMISDYVAQWLLTEGYAPRVKLHSVEVREHEGNSAVYYG